VVWYKKEAGRPTRLRWTSGSEPTHTVPTTVRRLQADCGQLGADGRLKGLGKKNESKRLWSVQRAQGQIATLTWAGHQEKYQEVTDGRRRLKQPSGYAKPRGESGTWLRGGISSPAGRHNLEGLRVEKPKSGEVRPKFRGYGQTTLGKHEGANRVRRTKRSMQATLVGPDAPRKKTKLVGGGDPQGAPS